MTHPNQTTRDPTHCPVGHPRVSEYTKTTSTTGVQQCLICKRRGDRAYTARKRALAAPGAHMEYKTHAQELEDLGYEDIGERIMVKTRASGAVVNDLDFGQAVILGREQIRRLAQDVLGWTEECHGA